MPAAPSQEFACPEVQASGDRPEPAPRHQQGQIALAGQVFTDAAWAAPLCEGFSPGQALDAQLLSGRLGTSGKAAQATAAAEAGR